ncbi:hypothetical protein ACWEO1_36175 [Kitasatospora cineracea]
MTDTHAARAHDLAHRTRTALEGGRREAAAALADVAAVYALLADTTASPVPNDCAADQADSGDARRVPGPAQDVALDLPGVLADRLCVNGSEAVRSRQPRTSPRPRTAS